MSIVLFCSGFGNHLISSKRIIDYIDDLNFENYISSEIFMENEKPDICCLLLIFFVRVRNPLSSLPFAMINATGMYVEDRDNDVLDLPRITHERRSVYSFARSSLLLDALPQSSDTESTKRNRFQASLIVS